VRAAGTAPVLQGHGASGLILLLDAVALAVAEGAPVRVSALCSPLWLAPCLAAGARGTALWGAAVAGGETVLQVAVDAAGAAVRKGGPPPHALHGLACEVRLGQGAPPAAPAGWALKAGVLERRRHGAVRDGVQVPAAAWEALAVFARQALVPESEASRARGAGGGDDNA